MRQFSSYYTKDPFVHNQFRENNSHRIVLTWSFTVKVLLCVPPARALVQWPATLIAESSFATSVVLVGVTSSLQTHLKLNCSIADILRLRGAAFNGGLTTKLLPRQFGVVGGDGCW